MSDSSDTLYKNMDQRIISIQNNTCQALPKHEKLKCNSVHFNFDAGFFFLIA